ncbi:MAG: GNAT family N-acetyltransferase [Bacteroidetes bacterium]|nr:GNAT family N-acetyltransferase [Bacteroidota bacterium]
MKILETDRLILRTWVDEDLESMLAINQDPKVMEYFPSLQDLDMTKNFIAKVNAHFKNHGYSLYAAVRKDTNEFIGFIGLLIADFESHFTPATEIGWRLSSNHWGQGFATEGAKAVLDYAFRELKIPEIVSFTAAGNAKSIRVMQKIGLQHNEADDFNHPKLDDKSPLKRHVLYRLSRNDYLNNAANITGFTFEKIGDPDASVQKIIRNGINEFNQSVINDKYSSFTLCVKENEKIIGGAIIYQHKDALYIDVLWCMEEYRNKGIVSKLIGMIDADAQHKSTKKLFVDTYAFQAQEFYKKHGFKIIGCAPEYLLGHDRIFMRKDI